METNDTMELGFNDAFLGCIYSSDADADLFSFGSYEWLND